MTTKKTPPSLLAVTDRRLPAEWERQGAVLLAWPGTESDWAPYLDRARATVVAMAVAISKRARVLLVSDDAASAQAAITAAGVANVTIVAQPVDDTWARDYGPITIFERGIPKLLDFGFNGWGLKFGCAEDNQASRRLHAAKQFGATALSTIGLILEGGSIESDGAGTILTTTACLLSPNRNPHLDRAEVEMALHTHLGAKRVLWLHHGHLIGDDTDAHIDTIARLCPGDTIAYVRCDDPKDEHYASFMAMEAELRRLYTASGRPYRLVPLPWCAPKIASDDGRRLPATYANFLFVNGAVLVPTYGDPAKDQAALAAVAVACPQFEIIAIDCTVLVEQHGSLHCMTMQIPEEVWTWTP